MTDEKRAADPEFGIDLDHPEASGIGSPPRRADFSARSMLVTSYRDVLRKKIPRARWTAMALAGEMITRTSVRSAIFDAEYILRLLRVVAEEDEEKKKSAVGATVGAASVVSVGSSTAASSHAGAEGSDRHSGERPEGEEDHGRKAT